MRVSNIRCGGTTGKKERYLRLLRMVIIRMGGILSGFFAHFCLRRALQRSVVRFSLLLHQQQLRWLLPISHLPLILYQPTTSAGFLLVSGAFCSTDGRHSVDAWMHGDLRTAPSSLVSLSSKLADDGQRLD